MSVDPYLRKQPWCFRGKGPTGRNLCFCGCGQEVGPKRHSSAGPACVKAWAAHSDLNGIKHQVENRDRGVCALCAADTFALKAAWIAALLAYDDKIHAGYSEEYNRERKRYQHWTTVKRNLCSDKNLPNPPAGFPSEDRRWWEADHIIPVIEGGGGCDFTGYRTLCVPCHRAETKALAARRAAKRRRAVELPLFFVQNETAPR